MKQFLLVAVCFTLMSVSHLDYAQAQSVNIRVNIGNQPAWGPVGYDYASYYYFPDIDVYYDVNRRMFYYTERRMWRSAQYLPYRYNRYDLYGMYKVVINQPEPWRYHDRYRKQYAQYRGYRNQPVLLNSSDGRYAAGRNNRIAWINPERSARSNDFVTQNRPAGGRSSADGRYSYRSSSNDNGLRQGDTRSNKSNGNIGKLESNQSVSDRYSKREDARVTIEGRKPSNRNSGGRSESLPTGGRSSQRGDF